MESVLVKGGVSEDFTFYMPPKNTYEWCFSHDFHGYIVPVVTPPNWFHRKMQTLILGIYWRKI